jgi:acetylglutamate kinase
VFDAAGHTCARLDESTARQMVSAGTAKDGMIAKLGACLDAIAGGVGEVRIVDGRAGEYLEAPGTVLC